MVDDLQNLGLVGTAHGLGKFIVIDQHELGTRHIDEVGLGEHADELTRGLVHHGEERLV